MAIHLYLIYGKHQETTIQNYDFQSTKIFYIVAVIPHFGRQLFIIFRLCMIFGWIWAKTFPFLMGDAIAIREHSTNIKIEV